MEEGKMRWKEFFKPTKWKIFMIFIIFLFSLVLFFIAVRLNGGLEGDMMGAPGHLIMYVLGAIYLPFAVYIRLIPELSSYLLLYVIWGITLLYLYLLSCIVFFIYNKPKSNKKKRK